MKDGEPRIFGFIYIDIVGSSGLSGPHALLMRTKANLQTQLFGINAIYDVMPLSWAGDGGVSALLIDKPESYDLLAECALHLFETVSFFNKMKGISNLVDSPISTRIVCHAGQAIFNKDGSLFHGAELNAIAKHERKIGIPNYVVLTEAVYSQITSESLRNAFALLSKKWEYVAEGQPKKLHLYVYPKLIERKKESLQPKVLYKDISWEEMVTLVARAFSKLGALVRVNVVIEGIEVDLLLKIQTGPLVSTTIVECKAYKGPVGVTVVREFHGRSSLLKDIQRGIIVSANGFTQQAKAVAESLGIQLMTMDELIQSCGGLDALPELPPEATAKPEKVFKHAFILMPFKEELNDVYYFGIRQPLEREGFVVERADEIQFVGGIVEKIRKSIEEADLIVAEMTDLNPNVYYEVGLAHALNKPVILITRSIENVPFDLRGMRYIVYKTAIDLVQKLSKLVRKGF